MNKIVFERGRINFFFFFDVSNLEGELEFTFVFIFVFHIVYVFLSTHAVMCSFKCFQKRQVYYDQDLLPLLGTSRLGVLDWDLCCILGNNV